MRRKKKWSPETPTDHLNIIFLFPLGTADHPPPRIVYPKKNPRRLLSQDHKRAVSTAKAEWDPVSMPSVWKEARSMWKSQNLGLGSLLRGKIHQKMTAKEYHGQNSRTWKLLDRNREAGADGRTLQDELLEMIDGTLKM